MNETELDPPPAPVAVPKKFHQDLERQITVAHFNPLSDVIKTLFNWCIQQLIKKYYRRRRRVSFKYIRAQMGPFRYEWNCRTSIDFHPCWACLNVCERVVSYVSSLTLNINYSNPIQNFIFFLLLTRFRSSPNRSPTNYHRELCNNFHHHPNEKSCWPKAFWLRQPFPHTICHTLISYSSPLVLMWSIHDKNRTSMSHSQARRLLITSNC